MSKSIMHEIFTSQDTRNKFIPASVDFLIYSVSSKGLQGCSAYVLRFSNLFLPDLNLKITENTVNDNAK